MFGSAIILRLRFQIWPYIIFVTLKILLFNVSFTALNTQFVGPLILHIDTMYIVHTLFGHFFNTYIFVRPGRTVPRLSSSLIVFVRPRILACTTVFCLLSLKITRKNFCGVIKIGSMLKYTFDTFSLSHSLILSVTGVIFIKKQIGQESTELKYSNKLSVC